MHKLCLLVAFALLSHDALGRRMTIGSDESPPQTPQIPQNWQLLSSSYPNIMFPVYFPWQEPNQGPGQQPGQLFPGQQFPQQQFPQQQFPQQQFPQQQFPEQQFPGIGGQYPWHNPWHNPWQNVDQFPIQNPGQDQNPGQVPDSNQSTTPAPSGSTTQSSAVQDCIRQCIVTSEYNPVCGTDNQTYDNPGRLLCAQSCGVNVVQVRASRCPTATVPPVA